MEYLVQVPQQKSPNVRFRDWMLPAVRVGVGLVNAASADRAGQLAEALFVRPRRHRIPDRERRFDRTAERFTIGTPIGQLAARSWGPEGAPTILLVHGWEGRGTQLGAVIEPLLERGYRVVAFDAPAHGDSPGTAATLLDFATAVEHVVAALDGVAGVIAHSLGAAATTLALARGAGIERVVYLAPVFAVSRSLRRFATVLELSPEAEQAFRRRLVERTDVPLPDVEGKDCVGELDVPCLVIHDVYDREVGICDAEELIASWPDAELVRTAGLGHRGVLRHPAAVHRLASFFPAIAEPPLSLPELVSRELFEPELRQSA